MGDPTSHSAVQLSKLRPASRRAFPALAGGTYAVVWRKSRSARHSRNASPNPSDAHRRAWDAYRVTACGPAHDASKRPPDAPRFAVSSGWDACPTAADAEFARDAPRRLGIAPSASPGCFTRFSLSDVACGNSYTSASRFATWAPSATQASGCDGDGTTLYVADRAPAARNACATLDARAGWCPIDTSSRLPEPCPIYPRDASATDTPLVCGAYTSNTADTTSGRANTAVASGNPRAAFPSNSTSTFSAGSLRSPGCTYASATGSSDSIGRYR